MAVLILVGIFYFFLPSLIKYVSEFNIFYFR